MPQLSDEEALSLSERIENALTNRAYMFVYMVKNKDGGWGFGNVLVHCVLPLTAEKIRQAEASLLSQMPDAVQLVMINLVEVAR